VTLCDPVRDPDGYLVLTATPDAESPNVLVLDTDPPTVDARGWSWGVYLRVPCECGTRLVVAPVGPGLASRASCPACNGALTCTGTT
jgi:hypothetical protein